LKSNSSPLARIVLRAAHDMPANPLTSAPRRLAAAALLLLLAGPGCTAATDDAAGAEPEASDRRAAVGDGTATTLWIHGRSPGGPAVPGDYGDFSYWGPAEAAPGVNPKAVNWDGGGRISETNGAIRSALDCFCTGDKWCYVAVHSAGNAQIGYALDLFGGTERSIKDGAPDASGECGDAGGTQVGWNIKWVDVAGGAAGGTELADLGYWAVSDPLTSDLRTATARSLYDHGNTGGAVLYLFAGAKGTLYSGVLPGQDDEVIAYHSSGGLAGTGSFCNPGDWFCDDELRLDAEGSKRGASIIPKWSHHIVVARDDGEAHDHYTAGSWGGIVSLEAADVTEYAR
jgi:hypothetical protein